MTNEGGVIVDGVWRRGRGWAAVAVLCWAVGAAADEAPADARLVEAQSAYDEAAKLTQAGRYPDAVAQAQRALSLREAALGGSHPQVASCLNLLGQLASRQGDSAHAEQLYVRALAINEAALGKSHLEVATSLTGLAIVYWTQGLYGRAEPLFERALAINEAAHGKHHPAVASVLNNLATLYKAQGLYGRAEPLQQRALAIYEEALGKDHPKVADALMNLATIYQAQGLYRQAGPLFERALASAETALGKDHPAVALALSNLSSFYADQGLYRRAEPLQQRALAIREAALGKNHPDVASSIKNLATIYFYQGQYTQAEPLYQRVLAVKEAAFGKNHPEVADALVTLASVYTVQGQYGRAEPLCRRALEISEAALGKSHPGVAQSLDSLASIYASQRLYTRAEPLYQRALALREAALGKNHPLVAVLLDNLANLFLAQGQYTRAEPLFQRALAINEATLGETHPYLVPTLTSLARTRAARSRVAEALPLLTRAFTISEERLRQEAMDFSEARLASFLLLLRDHEELLYALLRAHPDDAGTRRLALTAVLLRKGRSVEETADISRTVYRSLPARDRDTFERLRGLRTQYARLSLSGPGQLAPADYQQRLKEFVSQGDALEADLAKRSAPLRALAALPRPEEMVDRVAAALPRDGALVELVAYADRPLVLKPGTPESQLQSQLRYLALVLFPDGHTRALDLGPAAPIDRAASRLRDALASPNTAYQVPAKALYQLAFQPLIPLLGDVHRLYLAPDGQLGLVPFDAFHDGRRFLVDVYDFTYLTSGKDLLPRPGDVPPAGAVVILADPDFGAAPATPHLARGGAPELAERSSSVERFFSAARADLVDQPWAPLPGTRREAEAIHRLIPEARVLLGADATKEQLLQLVAPDILHIATHGFFLEDAAAPAGTRAVGHFGVLGEGAPTQRPPDPLLRSGLVLAGARAPGVEAGKPRLDGSLVTALELAGLDLWGTELVVLSACDTGRGEFKLGQGVYGLRRALMIAGAETLVASLWTVNDETTGALMESYYRNLLAGKGRAEALHEAMRALREKQPHPHAWAPFIVLGSDAPLRARPPPAGAQPAPSKASPPAQLDDR